MVQGTLGHAGIVLTVHTYVSVLPRLYHDSAGRGQAGAEGGEGNQPEDRQGAGGGVTHMWLTVTHDHTTRLQIRVKQQVGVVGRVGLEPTTHGLARGPAAPGRVAAYLEQAMGVISGELSADIQFYWRHIRGRHALCATATVRFEPLLLLGSR
ncbi:hypothetical protein [Nonomuraea jabiensis]|uniref:hypothetical protein n=1 Tax=Nonomuraea jabiensis TaxID=882448 RepID=UPI003D70F707